MRMRSDGRARVPVGHCILCTRAQDIDLTDAAHACACDIDRYHDHWTIHESEPVRAAAVADAHCMPHCILYNTRFGGNCGATTELLHAAGTTA